MSQTYADAAGGDHQDPDGRPSAEWEPKGLIAAWPLLDDDWERFRSH